MSALAKSAKGGEGDRLEVDVQALVLDDLVRAAILAGGHLVGGGTKNRGPHESSGGGENPKYQIVLGCRAEGIQEYADMMSTSMKLSFNHRMQ